MKLFQFLFCCLIGLSSYAQQYAQPMDINFLLSGTFGELRTNHYHSGIDIKTGGRIGVPVYAIEQGEIVRVYVSYGGFGKALYIQHPNGKTSVYAHLHEFTPEIEAYVKEQQYAQKKFKVDLYPAKGRFSVQKGEEIAKSGNSGSSGGPHLHFEIRDTRTEEPLSPIREGITVKDNKAPEFLRMALYNSNFEYVKDVSLLKTGNNQYECEGGIVSSEGNPFALGFKVYDRQEGTSNSNGVEHLEVTIDDASVFNWQFDRMNFNNSRYCNATQDIESRKRRNSIFHRAHNMPGNKMNYSIQSGVINGSAGEVLNMKAISWDHNDNKAIATCKIKLEGSNAKTPSNLLRQGVPNTIEKPGFKMEIPADALYRDIEGKVVPIEPRGISNAYTFLDMYQALHKHATIRIEAKDIQEAKRKKVVAVEQNHKNRKYYESGKWEGNWFVFRTRSTGRWWLDYDEDAPTIRPAANYNGKTFSAGNTLKFTVQDKMIGLDEFNAYLDGKWVLMEYDAKRDLMSIQIDNSHFPKGKHTLELKFSDYVGNTSSYKIPIIIQ